MYIYSYMSICMCIYPFLLFNDVHAHTYPLTSRVFVSSTIYLSQVSPLRDTPSSSASNTPSCVGKHRQLPQPLSSPSTLPSSLEQLFLQTQLSMKKLRSHAKKARGKLKIKADQGIDMTLCLLMYIIMCYQKIISYAYIHT